MKLLKGKNSPMEDALLQTWEEKFQNVADHTADAKTCSLWNWCMQSSKLI